MDLSIQTESDIGKWRTFFAIVSLDKVTPYLPGIGLEVQEPERLRAIARRFVVSCDETWAAGSSPDMLGRIESFLRKAFEQLRLQLGSDVARVVCEVARYGDPGPEQSLSKSLWGLLLIRLDDNLQRTPLPLSPEQVLAFREAAQRYWDEWDPWDQRYSAEGNAPQFPGDVGGAVSEWDAQIYAEDWLPMTQFFDMIEWRLFLRFAAALHQLVTPADLAILLAWGQQVLGPKLGKPLLPLPEPHEVETNGEQVTAPSPPFLPGGPQRYALQPSDPPHETSG